MNKTKLISTAAGVMTMLAVATPAFAHDGEEHDDSHVEVHASTSVTVRGEDRVNFFSKINVFGTSTREKKENNEDKHASTTQKKIEKAQDQGTEAIDKRIEDLKKLSERLGQIKLIPADTLASIRASLDAQIKQLVDLKAKIQADTATTTLKGDIKSITQGNRVYLLVEPKARIAAAASRIKAVVTQMNTLTTKLQDRITAAQTAGADVSAAVSAMTDLKAKLADATVQADAAVSGTANLQPDNGDKTVQASNTAALKTAREKLATAQKDLAAARHDAAVIYSVVKGKGGSVHATTTATTH